jgi:hypothetical protein
MPSELEREMLAGPAAPPPPREKTLGTHLFMELFAFSRESPHAAMGRSSRVKVDFDKSHIHKRAARRHAAQIHIIPTNSAKKILNLSRDIDSACAFFAAFVRYERRAAEDVNFSRVLPTADLKVVTSDLVSSGSLGSETISS